MLDPMGPEVDTTDRADKVGPPRSAAKDGGRADVVCRLWADGLGMRLNSEWYASRRCGRSISVGRDRTRIVIASLAPDVTSLSPPTEGARTHDHDRRRRHQPLQRA